jgi:hypothetical protein
MSKASVVPLDETQSSNAHPASQIRNKSQSPHNSCIFAQLFLPLVINSAADPSIKMAQFTSPESSAQQELRRERAVLSEEHSGSCETAPCNANRSTSRDWRRTKNPPPPRVPARAAEPIARRSAHHLRPRSKTSSLPYPKPAATSSRNPAKPRPPLWRSHLPIPARFWSGTPSPASVRAPSSAAFRANRKAHLHSRSSRATARQAGSCLRRPRVRSDRMPRVPHRHPTHLARHLWGGHCEYAVTSADAVVPVPEGLDLRRASGQEQRCICTV